MMIILFVLLLAGLPRRILFVQIDEQNQHRLREADSSEILGRDRHTGNARKVRKATQLQCIANLAS